MRKLVRIRYFKQTEQGNYSAITYHTYLLGLRCRGAIHMRDRLLTVWTKGPWKGAMPFFQSGLTIFLVPTLFSIAGIIPFIQIHLLSQAGFGRGRVRFWRLMHFVPEGTPVRKRRDPRAKISINNYTPNYKRALFGPQRTLKTNTYIIAFVLLHRHLFKYNT